MTSTTYRGSEQGVAWLRELHSRAVGWIQRQRRPWLTARTEPYVDLSFAFGLASLGDQAGARERLAQARACLADGGDAHQFLCRAYEYRVQQAMAGHPHTGRLPEEHLAALEQMDRLSGYVVDRLRKRSTILEPEERINPYRHWGGPNNFWKALSDLSALTDRDQFLAGVGNLLAWAKNEHAPGGTECAILAAALNRPSLLGEDFTRELLGQSLEVWRARTSTGDRWEIVWQARLLERALRGAAYFALSSESALLISAFMEWLRDAGEDAWLPCVEEFLEPCILGLFHLHLCDCEVAAHLLNETSRLLLKGETLARWNFAASEESVERLRALLQVARGWYALGRNCLADPILEQARGILFSDRLLSMRAHRTQGDSRRRQLTGLACASARAVSLAPQELASAHLTELFDRLTDIGDVYTTSSHYSVAQIEVVEAIVLSAVEVCRPAK